MASVAEQLRLGRSNRNLTVEQVAEITKMRTDHIRALEEGNFGAFSAPVYVKGFVRSYATLLKLEVPEVMAALDAELAQDRKLADPRSLSDSPQGLMDGMMLRFSKMDWRKLLLGGAAAGGILVLVVSYLAWRHHRDRNPLEGLRPGVYQSTQTVSGETLPLPGDTPARR